ncbi:hypothetical protein JW752_01865 [Candidatus Peregrinibacteria bacterium]|nr:hypothetical protein [Candidatus Peregrinibacteria bacterium]
MKRFALIVAVTLIIVSPASAKEVTFEQKASGPGVAITEYDARALYNVINANNGTVVFYEDEADKDRQNHRILFWSEKFPPGTADFDRENYQWGNFTTCEQANPNANNPVKRVFRVSELEEKGLQIRTYELKLECLLYAHLTVEKGKRKVSILPVTLNMVGRFLPDGDVNNWLISSLGIPLEESPLVPRDRYLTRGAIDAPEDQIVQDEEVKIVSYRDDSVDYFSPTEPKLSSAGQAAATVEHGVSGTTSFLLILALLAGLYFALIQLITAINMRRTGAHITVATPGRLGKSLIGAGSLVCAIIIAYSFSPVAALAMVGAGCLAMVLTGTFVKPNTNTQRQLS